jgi:hypothetical protein
MVPTLGAPPPRRERRYRDPRAIRNDYGRLPYHVAMRKGYQWLQETLDPSVPVRYLLTGVGPAAGQLPGAHNEAAVKLLGSCQGSRGEAAGKLPSAAARPPFPSAGEELDTTGEWGPPRLAVIAAKALHVKLLADLEDIKAVQAAAAAAAAAAAMASASGSAAASPPGGSGRPSADGGEGGSGAGGLGRTKSGQQRGQWSWTGEWGALGAWCDRTQAGLPSPWRLAPGICRRLHACPASAPSPPSPPPCLGRLPPSAAVL